MLMKLRLYQDVGVVVKEFFINMYQFVGIGYLVGRGLVSLLKIQGGYDSII